LLHLDRRGLLLLNLLRLFLHGFRHLLLLLRHRLNGLLHLRSAIAGTHGRVLAAASRLLHNGTSRLELGNILTLIGSLNHLGASTSEALIVGPHAGEALGEEQLKNYVTD
jgi:hypothetical protein